MERSFKKIWISRFLALLIISVVLSTLTFSAVKRIGSFDYKIEVRANDAEPIVKAVENLEISEIYIKTSETSRFENNENIFKHTIVAFLILGAILGLYYSLYCLVSTILFWPKKDKNILTQP